MQRSCGHPTRRGLEEGLERRAQRAARKTLEIAHFFQFFPSEALDGAWIRCSGPVMRSRAADFPARGNSTSL